MSIQLRKTFSVFLLSLLLPFLFLQNLRFHLLELFLCQHALFMKLRRLFQFRNSAEPSVPIRCVPRCFFCPGLFRFCPCDFSFLQTLAEIHKNACFNHPRRFLHYGKKDVAIRKYFNNLRHSCRAKQYHGDKQHSPPDLFFLLF